MKINPSLAVMFVVSLAVWLAVSAASGGGEAWDHDAYWSIGLPALYLAAGVAGCTGRSSAWSLGLWSALGQFAGLLMTASGWSLWPLGLFMLGLLGLPAVLTAAVARALRNRLSAPTAR